jgi:hypothetical protein
MDAGTPKEVPYRWFLRLTEPANPPHDKAKEDEAREQKVEPPTSRPLKRAGVSKRGFQP